MSIQLLKNELVKEREEKYKLAKIIRDYENNQSIEKPAENFSGSKMITNPMNEVNLNISFLHLYNNFSSFLYRNSKYQKSNIEALGKLSTKR